MTNEAKRLGRNFSVTAIGQFISQLLTFVVSIVLARTLGVEQYGIFIFGFAFPSWFLLFVSLGLDAVITIEVAADKKRASRYLTSVALMRLPLLVVAILTLWIFVNLILSDPFARTITLILGLATILHTYAGTFASIFRAYERLEYSALAMVIERIITAAVVLLLLWSGYGLLEISLAFILGSGVYLVLCLVFLRARFTWFSREVDFRTVSRLVKLGIPFALMGVVTTFTDSTGPVLLTILLDSSATGLFNAALTLLFAILSFLSIFHFVLLPVLSRIYRESPDKVTVVLQQTQKIFFIFGLPLALGGWLYSEQIMTLFYGDSFLESARSLEVLIFGVAISTAVLGNGAALAASGRQVINLYIGIATAATTIGLSFALIPSWGPVGVAYATLAAALLKGILGLAAVRRVFARVDLWSTFGRTSIAGVAMLAILYVIPGLSLWVGIGLGGFLYFALLVLMRGITRDDWDIFRSALGGAFFR